MPSRSPALHQANQMVVGAVVSRERDDRVRQWTLSTGIICALRADEARGTPCPLTLAKARVSVKNSHGHCCASANGPSDDADFHLSAGALIGSARMPVRVGEMSPAEPLAAAVTILLGGKVAGFIHARDSLTELFLGFCACCVHRILHGTRGGAAGKGDLSLRARPRRL